ncbi:MAG: hypothetical protein IPF99_22635 [Deltaproteobacteria bacterium]|nr:hypothetical protein [Deltaproteobacteria bacterium]
MTRPLHWMFWPLETQVSTPPTASSSALVALGGKRTPLGSHALAPQRAVLSPPSCPTSFAPQHSTSFERAQVCSLPATTIDAGDA